MIFVKGTYPAFVDYVGPQKGKKSKDAVIYTLHGTPETVVFQALLGPNENEAILWEFVSRIYEKTFLADFPKAILVETIQ